MPSSNKRQLRCLLTDDEAAAWDALRGDEITDATLLRVAVRRLLSGAV